MELCDPKGEFAMCIEVNEQKLQIHQIQHFINDPSGSRSEGWIASEPESSYRPRIEFSGYYQGISQRNRHPDLGLQLRVDGKLTESYAVLKARGNYTCHFSGPQVSADSRRPYVFNKPILLEDQSMLGESEASSLGSITITVCRKKYQLSVAKGVTIQTPSLHDSLSEKEKKAALSLITQSIGSCGPFEVLGRKIPPLSQLDSIDSPYHKFTIRYGTKAQLQAMGIVPPDPAGEGNELINEEQTADLDAVRKAEEELQKAQEALAAVRQAEEDLERAQAALARAREQGGSSVASGSGSAGARQSKRKPSTDDDTKPNIKKVKAEKGPATIDLTQDHDVGPIDLTLDD